MTDCNNSQPRSELRPGVPPTQKNMARAVELAVESLAEQTSDQLEWLGATPTEPGCQLPVLEDTLDIDTTSGRITTAAGQDVAPFWQILILHYLDIRDRPDPQPPSVTFADLSNARSYNSVYQGRVIARFCGTSGRKLETLTTAAESLAGKPTTGGDAAFDFAIFPQLTLRLIWHAPDEEFPPSATLLLPPNIEDYLCSEDIVVLSESLVARLGGRPF